MDLEVSAAAAVKAPLAGEIRLTWWGEELERLRQGGAGRAHPALGALRDAAPEALEALQRSVEARAEEFDPRPFQTLDELTAHLRRADGAFLGACLRLLEIEGGAPVLIGPPAEEAFGFRRLLREAPGWRAGGRSFIPADRADPDPAAFARGEILSRLPQLRRCVAQVPAAAFPALAGAALLATEARGGAPTQLGVRLRILRASATGRI